MPDLYGIEQQLLGQDMAAHTAWQEQRRKERENPDDLPEQLDNLPPSAYQQAPPADPAKEAAARKQAAKDLDSRGRDFFGMGGPPPKQQPDEADRQGRELFGLTTNDNNL